MKKSIIIIGAGIAGLSAGCYGQMNGYDTHIFELHDKPGGLCTGWKRKGYEMDACIHWLVGTKPGSAFNRIWNELGALQGKEIFDPEELLRFEGSNGKTFVLYTDVDRLEQHMLELAPTDVEAIKDFTAGIRTLSRWDVPLLKPREIQTTIESLKSLMGMLPFIRPLRKYGKISERDLASRFSDPLLNEAFSNIFDLGDFPVLFLVMTLVWMNVRDAGYPIGGSLEFARSIERRYLDLGGEISYRARVEEILVEGGRAAAVRLQDGIEHRGDRIISAADGHATIFEMLGGKYTDEKLRERYREAQLFRPLVQVSLGISADLSGEPNVVSFPLASPIEIAGETRKRITVEKKSLDPTLAPPGKSILTVLLVCDYSYWERLYQDKERYDSEKLRVADIVTREVEARFPAIAGHIEVVDVATPVTWYRYTNNWQGSYQGWLLTTKNALSSLARGMSKTLPGLEDFYMIGQWVMPGGGLPPAAQSGRDVIQIICDQDGKVFQSSLP